MSLAQYRAEELKARRDRVEAFKRIAAASNMNVNEADLADLNDVREILVKQADARTMTSSGTFTSTTATKQFNMVANDDRIMDSTSPQTDRPVVVLAAGFWMNGDILVPAAMEKITRLGIARFQNMGQDYPNFDIPLEELLAYNGRQPTVISVDSDLSAGSGALSYTFEHIKRTDLWALPKPLYVGRNSKPTIEIVGLDGQTSMGSELKMQAKLLILQPVK